MAELEKLRPLGLWEAFMFDRSRLGIYNSVGLTATYSTTTPPAESLKSLVFRALAVVVQRHPVLSAVPVHDDHAAPYFAKLPVIDLEKTVRFVEFERSDGDEKLDALIQSEHNRAFDTEPLGTPFWRLIVITSGEEPGFTGAFIWHHGLGDTTSALIFHETLAAALNTTGDSAPLTTTIVPASTKPLPPVLEELSPLTVSNAYLQAQRQPTAPPPATLWAGPSYALPARSRFRSLTFSREITTRFAAACRAQRTTVTAGVQTLIARTLFGLVPERYSLLRCESALTFRRWFPPEVVGEMGVWVSTYGDAYGRGALQAQGEDSFWDEARRAKGVIENALERRGADMPVGYLPYVDDMAAWMMEKIGKERQNTFELTNIGVVRAGSQDGWRLGRVIFSQSCGATGGVFKCSFVTGGDGRLALGFAWQEGVAEEGLMKELIDGVGTGVREIAQ